MNRIVPLLLCLLLLASLFTGCVEEQLPHVPTGDALAGEDATLGTLPPQDTEQELTLVYYKDKPLNPLTCTDFTNRALFPLLYQSLFVTDRDYNAYPLLCKSFHRSKDMKTYVFYIAEATFSDGTPLEAQDVVATLQAAKTSPAYSGRFTHITGVSLTEDGGVQVRLSCAMENLPLLLDIPILRGDQLEEEMPLGTGPYSFSTALGRARLLKNNNWWCKASLVATASSVQLVEAQSPAQIRDQFEFGDVGVVCADPGSDHYADYRCDFELWDCENGIFLYLGCNVESPVFSNPKVRSSLTYAIDRDMIVDSYYRGFARSAALPASPLSPYYSKGLAANYEMDSVRLAQALNETGLSGSPIVLLVNKDDSLRVRASRAISRMLTDCGLVVTTKELGGSNYTKALKNKEYDLYLGQTKLSANMDLSPFFATKGALSQGGMSDPAMYALCLEALANSGNYYTLHKTVADDGRLCPILFRSYAVYAKRGLVSDLTPARDNVFFYHLGKTADDVLIPLTQ